MIVQSIKKLVEGKDLTEQEAMETMNTIMSGEATHAQIGSFLTALRIKGESIDEIAGCARVMREKADRIRPNVPYYIDTCGTGGDGSNTFNISTAAAFVAAAGGVAVAKHGNRSMSSKCGCADVLEALGININLEPHQVEKCIEDINIGFMFAQTFHKSMKHAAGPRKELGFRTVFNMLGPLTNPAGAKGQLLGVYDKSLTEPVANVLLKLGVEKAMVIHGLDGMDEISTTGKTKVSEVKDGHVDTYEIDPLEYGIERASKADLEGGNAAENAQMIKAILNGEKGHKRNIVLINAAAALYVGKAVEKLQDGVAVATEIIDSKKALNKLLEFCEYTQNIK
ncbi:MAG TPA: anthranilate phosphoribosyltransferase [Clostridia bacterium]